MPIREFTEYQPGDEVSAGEMNRLQRTVERLGEILAPGLVHSEEGTAIAPPDPAHIDVKITAVTTISGGRFAYSWTEQQAIEAGTWADKPGGLSGTDTYLPLFERNNVGTVPVDSIVEAAQGTGLFFLFDQATAAGGSLTVKEVDNAPTVTSVTTLNFDQTDGFTVTDSGGGVARIDMLAASYTQAGIVSLVAQVMGDGKKTFSDSVTVNNDRSQYRNPNVGGVTGLALELWNESGSSAGSYILTAYTASSSHLSPEVGIGRLPQSNYTLAISHSTLIGADLRIGSIETGIYGYYVPTGFAVYTTFSSWGECVFIPVSSQPSGYCRIRVEDPYTTYFHFKGNGIHLVPPSGSDNTAYWAQTGNLNPPTELRGVSATQPAGQRSVFKGGICIGFVT